MRILMVNYEFPPIGGGAATATLNLAKALRSMGHEVCVLTSAIDQLWGSSIEDGIAVVRVPALRQRRDRASIWEMLTFSVAGLLALPGIVRRFQPERAIVMFSVPCGHIGLALKKIWGISYVVSLRGGDVPGYVPSLDRFHKVLGPLRRAILANARAVVANSDGLANLSRKTDPFDVAVITNGVDCSFFRPAGRRKGEGEPFKFLFVGRFAWEKMLSRLIDELPELRRDGAGVFVLHIVGDGPGGPDLKRQVDRLGLSYVVNWHGWIDRDQLRELYQACDCMVNTSQIEGMSNAVLEAMASGLAVIASAVQGNTETVVDGKTGILFDPENNGELQQALRRVICDREFTRTLGERGREVVLAKFSWESSAEKYLDLLKAQASTEQCDAI